MVRRVTLRPVVYGLVDLRRGRRSGVCVYQLAARLPSAITSNSRLKGESRRAVRVEQCAKPNRPRILFSSMGCFEREWPAPCKLEFELIHAHRTHKLLLRIEVGANKARKITERYCGEVVWAGAGAGVAQCCVCGPLYNLRILETRGHCTKPKISQLAHRR